MFAKEQVKKNRQKIRMSLQGCLITIDNEKKMNYQKNEKKISISLNGNIRKRKRSEDITIDHTFHFMKELYTNNSFVDLFHMKEKIGEGNHSVVYKCIDKNSEEEYAVKILRTSDPQRIAFFKEQYNILKVLIHPSIMKVKYMLINQKQCTTHLVCQLCKGVNLKQYINKQGRLKQSEVAEIIQQILYALIFMHKKGIAHRDLKPENIMINQQTRSIKIIDFQIAKRKPDNQHRLQMLTNTGTLHYKAPQMFKGLYNQQIDIWAVGVITYEMVTGQLPFKSEYTKDIIKKICEQDPIVDEKLLTSNCMEFILKCLAKKPLNRFTAIEATKSQFILKQFGTSSTNTPYMENSINIDLIEDFNEDQQNSLSSEEEL